MAAAKKLSKTDVVIGTFILVAAQVCCASTASCVHSLPAETPSVLRGLWRQTLTSIIFSALSLLVLLCTRDRSNNEDEPHGNSDRKEDRSTHSNTPAVFSFLQIALVTSAVVGAALQNDAIVIALQYASSAAVMCLCNTTPIWLILYAIVNCGIATPGLITVAGALLSLMGAIVCAASGGEDAEESYHENESLGALIATIGGVGGAIYMTACRKLAPVGIHPVQLTLVVNIGMMLASLGLCLATLSEGIAFFSTDITNGFFGFLNPKANPAALLHSVFPDCGGNFGIMLALSYFEPLIVSMVMLTEPLNASLIAMRVVGEAPPSRQTIFGVAIVLVGCGIVLWESSKEGKELAEIEREEEIVPIMSDEQRTSVRHRRRESQLLLFAPIRTIAPDVTAKASLYLPSSTPTRRSTLPTNIIRDISLSSDLRSDSSSSGLDLNGSSSRRLTLSSSIIRSLGQRVSNLGAGSFLSPRGSVAKGYGTIERIEEEEEETNDSLRQ